MELLNDEVAYLLQFYTFPMEFVGLILATIEVRFPLVAQKMVFAVKPISLAISCFPEREQIEKDYLIALGMAGVQSV